MLLATWDGSETGGESHRIRPEEGLDTHMGLVGKTGCLQMHKVSLSVQYSTGKGDEMSQQSIVATSNWCPAPCSTMCR